MTRYGQFCHWVAFPGDLIALDAFYIGNLKRVGKCYQLGASVYRRMFTSIRQLQAEADVWLTSYNTARRNHSAYMKGATPAQMLDTRLAAMAV